MPDDHARAALGRLRAGTPLPGDTETAREWTARLDPRYVEYMRTLAQGPRETADVLTGEYVKRPAAGGKVLGRLAELAETGDLGMCVHVRSLAPQPALWLAWFPGKLRCRACAAAASARITGTAADRTCDACGHVGAGISSMSQLTPPVEHMQVVVRILVIFGLCKRCAGLI